MSEEKLARFVKNQLDASLATIPQNRREALKRVRQEALQKRVQKSESRLAGVAGVFHLDMLARRALVRFAALLLLSLGISYWHAQDYIVELAEVDSAILTDEMPIDVITDKGFDAWLSSSAEH